MYPRISPDGGRVVALILDGKGDLWSWDFAGLNLNSLTFTPGQDIYPVWAPNGQRLIFASERVGTFNLYWQSADGTGVERLTTSTNVQFPTAISPDGARVIFTETTSATREDVMQMELTGTHTLAQAFQGATDHHLQRPPVR